MKKTYSLALAAFAATALFTTPALAGKCPTCGKLTDTNPYPVKVVKPTNLPRTFVKSTVNLALTVDENGVPKDIKPVGRVDKAVAARVIAAVSQWRFSPKQVDGVPVAGEFVLPVEVTATEGA